MSYLAISLLFILALVLLFWQGSNFVSMLLGAPPVSSPTRDFLKQFADSNKTFLDIGCGAGAILLQASLLFKHVYGIEASPFYYLLAKWRTRKLKNVTIIYGNFFKLNWPKVDYIYCYLLPALLEKATPKLRAQKATILSLGFAIPNWKPTKEVGKSPFILRLYN